MIPKSAIPKYSGVTNTHSDMADNADIRSAIFGAVPEAVSQTKELSKYFERKSQRETCKLIFDFLKNEVNYLADGSTQVIKLPSALLKTKVGDCKSYSLLTSAILTNCGIPHHFVLVSFNQDPTPSHIFVETDDGCKIDAVYGIFDAEKKPTYRYKVKTNGDMKVKTMAGIGNCGCGCNGCRVGGIGATRPNSKAEVNSFCENKFKGKSGRIKTCKTYWNAINWAEKTAANAGTNLKVVGLAAGRNLFLVLVKANLDGFGTKLSKMNQSNLFSLWKKVGGNPTNLQDAIKKGSQKPSKKLGLLGFLAKKSKKGTNGVSGGMFDESAVSNTIMSAATAAGTAINAGAGTAAGASLGAVLKAMLPMIMEALNMLLPADASDGINNVSVSSEELANADTEQSIEDFTAEMEKVFPASSGYSDSVLLSIYNGLSKEKKSVWKAMQVKYGRPKDSNTTTYLVIGAALVGAYFYFNKK